MRKSLVIISVIMLALFSCQNYCASETSNSADQLVLIVNADTEIKSLSRKELRSLFSLRRSVWSDGTNVRLVTMPDGHKLHKDFIEKQLKLFPYQVKRIWNRQIYSGSAISPLRAKSTAELIDLVGKTKGAIGYSLASETKAINNEQVKIVSIN